MIELCDCGTPSVAHAAVLHERPTLDGCPWCRDDSSRSEGESSAPLVSDTQTNTEEKNGTGWCWRHWAEAHDYFDEER